MNPFELHRLREPRYLARAISLVENSSPGSREILHALGHRPDVPVIGITGSPGAGKSSLVNALIGHYTSEGKRVAVIAVDPTSPFNFGSLLGDRVRMAEHFNNPNVYIRSMATRGSLGGLCARIYEVTDLLRNAGFDLVIVETVGVGQSEVEIAGLADTTIVVTVPEGGDEIQTLKSGVMEIADIFVVNKSDREGAGRFADNLRKLVHGRGDDTTVPVISTVATTNTGIPELAHAAEQHNALHSHHPRRAALLLERLLHIISENRMKDVNTEDLRKQIEEGMNNPGFNLYVLAGPYLRL